MTTTNQKVIIDSISEEIANMLRSMENERNFPGHSPDKMDETISRCKDDANELRKIREQLENLFAKP